MAIRNDDSVAIVLPSLDQFSTKEEIRAFLMMQWINEFPETKYRYFVETYNNNLSLYLERPGRLNKGCDFVIYAENAYIWNNGNDRPPDHNYVFDDLKLKKTSLSSAEWKTVLFSINQIYNTRPYSIIMPNVNTLPKIGKPYELIIKLIKWFFIEQDITYWFGQGRNMLYEAINTL
jgi:hypothetical protein